MSSNTLIVVQPSFEFITPPEAIKALLPLIERAGRTCYKSEDKINDESAEKFIANIVKRGHMSVIEHGNVTVKYICSRACSHQLVRHRIASYSQESQRYCDYSPDKKADGGFSIIVPFSINESGGCPPGTYKRYVNGNLLSWESEDHHFSADKGNDAAMVVDYLEDARDAYEKYLKWRKRGQKPEDARFHLPNMCKTEVTTTFNLRQWHHVFQDRALNPHAQWEIKAITMGILHEFAKHLPCIFSVMDPDCTESA